LSNPGNQPFPFGIVAQRRLLARELANVQQALHDPLLPVRSTRSGQSGTRRFFYSLVMPIELLDPPRR